LINVSSARGRAQGQAEFIARMARLELALRNDVRPIIQKQFDAAARMVARGPSAADAAVASQADELAASLTRGYVRTETVFVKEAVTELERLRRAEKKASTLDTFWATLRGWNKQQTATQVRNVNATTRATIRNIISTGMNLELSNADIASEIASVGNIASWTRATTIARTETHTAAVNAFHTAVESTGVPMDHIWVSTLDERTRNWHADINDQRKPLNKPFDVDGGKMPKPGDASMLPASKAARNVVNCRCVEMFEVRRKK